MFYLSPYWSIVVHEIPNIETNIRRFAKWDKKWTKQNEKRERSSKGVITREKQQRNRTTKHTWDQGVFDFYEHNTIKCVVRFNIPQIFRHWLFTGEVITFFFGVLIVIESKAAKSKAKWVKPNKVSWCAVDNNNNNNNNKSNKSVCTCVRVCEWVSVCWWLLSLKNTALTFSTDLHRHQALKTDRYWKQR